MNAVVQLQPQAGGLVVQPNASHRAVAEVIEHVKTVQEIMRAVMKPDVHYGVIPGTDKPTLLKAGAELLCMTFRIADAYQIEDLSTADTVRYRVTCIGTHQTTGTVLGTGMGEASSLEEKYKWLKATKREWEATPETLRRVKYGWSKKDRKEYEILQVRTEPANLANTVLKMANKRAKLAMVLNVTAASDMFTQDLEDMEDRLREHLADGEDDSQPQQEAAVQQPATWPDDAFDKQLPKFAAALEKGRSADDVIAWAETRGKLTEQQKQRIRDAAPKEAKEEPPAASYAQVADAIQKAQDQDQLAAAATLIPAVADEAQRAELTALHATRSEELPAF